MKNLKIPYFRGFTSIDMILMLSIMFTVVSLVVPIVLNGIDSSKVERAEKEIRQMAHAAAFLPLVQNQGNRLPASLEDSPKLDPWGHAYRKNIVRDLNGRPSQVIVWSLGPNGVPESFDFDPDQRGERVSVHFGGDDFGTVAPIAE
jgi:hypothetical protein